MARILGEPSAVSHTPFALTRASFRTCRGAPRFAASRVPFPPALARSTSEAVMPRRILSCLFATCVLVLIAAAALAAAVTKPVTSARPMSAAPVPTQQIVHPPLSPEERALLAVQEEGRTQVQTLLESMRGVSDGPALRALQQKVETIKRDTRVAFLRVTADFARRRGDLAAAHEAEDLAEAILHPAPVTTTGVVRPVPEKERLEGGRP